MFWLKWNMFVVVVGEGSFLYLGFDVFLGRKYLVWGDIVLSIMEGILG